MPFSLPIYTLSFLPGFMYVISGRSEKFRNHSFSLSDKPIRSLSRVSASFSCIRYRLTNLLITSVFLRGLTGNSFSALLMLRYDACFVQKDFGVLSAGCCWFFWRCSSPTFLLLASPSFFLWRYNLNRSFSSSFWFLFFSGCFTWNRVNVLHTSTKSLFSHRSTIKPLFKSVKFDWEYELETLN